MAIVNDPIIAHVRETTLSAEPSPVAPVAAAAASAAAEEAVTKAASANATKFKEAGSELAKGGKAVLEAVKAFFVGGKDKVAGGVGGVAGFLKGAGNAAVSIVTGTGKAAGKTMQSVPILLTAAIAVGAAIGIKKWMDKRDQQKELQGLRNANELVETKMANDDAQSQLGGKKPEFDNEVAGNAAAKVTAARAAAQGQQTARA